MSLKLSSTGQDITIGQKGLSGHWTLDKSDTTTGTTNTVTNGTFDSDTGWNKGTGWTISGGTANSDGSQTTSSQLSQAVTINDGDPYITTYTISNYYDG